MTLPGTAQARTIDLLNAIDEDLRLWVPGDPTSVAFRHLVECLTRVVQQHPGTAEFVETYAARAAEALDLIEAEP
jgi:hypothetical protein